MDHHLGLLLLVQLLLLLSAATHIYIKGMWVTISLVNDVHAVTPLLLLLVVVQLAVHLLHLLLVGHGAVTHCTRMQRIDNCSTARLIILLGTQIIAHLTEVVNDVARACLILRQIARTSVVACLVVVRA